MLNSKNEDLTIIPIGQVRTNLKEEEIRGNRTNVISEIEIRREFEDGLQGIEEYSHLIVLFWMHLSPTEERKQLIVYSFNDPTFPTVGEFAVRRRTRPNAVGLAVVELLERKGNVLRVKGLDALDGSPVIDIKSFDSKDRPESIRVPQWWSDRNS